MLTSKILTIEEHQKLVGNKFQLAQVIMRRTRQLMNGAPIYKGLPADLGVRNRFNIPNHRYPKIALEELRLGKFTWARENTTDSAISELEDHPIVFGE